MLGVATTVLLAGVLALLWPASLGGDVSYVLVSGASMEPGMHTGDLVLVRDTDDYDPGDVVAFRIPEGEVGAGSQVIHRIVGGDGTRGYEMLGDNKDARDPWRPTDADIVGERYVLVPGLGTLLAAARTPGTLAALAAAGTFGLIALPPRARTGSRRPARS